MGNERFHSNHTNVTFLDQVKIDLKTCDAFSFSVSFIKKAGLVLMEKEIVEALQRGAIGKLITSTYQNFTDTASLELFLEWQKKYPNFECHLDIDCFGDDGFHSKGYLFQIGNKTEVIIGSSNITYFALKKNIEWDIAVFADNGDPLLADIHEEFDFLWRATKPLDATLIHQYRQRIEFSIEQWDMDYFDAETRKSIKPNAMQRKALKEIRRYRNMGAQRALVIAATASGKTYLAAFDALNVNAKKLLFVVHKDMILESALKTFMTVFGKTRTYGIYNGDNDGTDADFIFASNVMLARHLALFDEHEFDYIVIDEVHHAVASTYRKIIEHFKPAFLLGLTATPDRLDQESVYDLFDKNVPYDLRLREALENDLVVPFHYFGIKDSLIDYGDVDTPSGVRRYISQLCKEDHCSFVKEQIEAHRPNGKLKCIAFCRNVEHARLMCLGMEEQGYTCTYLTGENSTGERIKAFDGLQKDDEKLEIVFAVDILNEGIDVPGINMVLFLRPTESSTIFIQQLGRGLRKFPHKQYVTVLDFIGNSYKRSVQIALALGTLTKGGSMDKRTIQDIVRTDGSELAIPGVELHFDRESVDEILSSIDKTNFNRADYLRQDYLNFKAYLKLGVDEYPKHTDFLNAEVSADLLRYTKKATSYFDFLQTIARQSGLPSDFTENELNVIRTLSWFLPLVRPMEYQIVQALLEGPCTSTELKAKCMVDETHVESFEHSLKVLQNKIYFTKPSFFVQFIQQSDDGEISLTFDTKNGAFLAWIQDLLQYGLDRFDIDFHDDPGLLHLYGQYTGPKSFMALNNSNMFYMTGVHYLQKGLCLYINLHKGAVEEHLKYEDRFIDAKTLQWESQTETTMDNKKGRDLIDKGRAFIFVRKSKSEDGVESPFVYLGEGTLHPLRAGTNPKKTVIFQIVLDHEVPEGYRYDFSILKEDA